MAKPRISTLDRAAAWRHGAEVACVPEAARVALAHEVAFGHQLLATRADIRERRTQRDRPLLEAFPIGPGVSWRRVVDEVRREQLIDEVDTTSIVEELSRQAFNDRLVVLGHADSPGCPLQAIQTIMQQSRRAVHQPRFRALAGVLRSAVATCDLPKRRGMVLDVQDALHSVFRASKRDELVRRAADRVG
jgi:hypothetical protein